MKDSKVRDAIVKNGKLEFRVKDIKPYLRDDHGPLTTMFKRLGCIRLGPINEDTMRNGELGRWWGMPPELELSVAAAIRRQRG